MEYWNVVSLLPDFFLNIVFKKWGLVKKVIVFSGHHIALTTPMWWDCSGKKVIFLCELTIHGSKCCYGLVGIFCEKYFYIGFLNFSMKP